MKHLAFACSFLVLISCMLSAQTNPVPFINQPLVPETVAPGNGGFTLTVHGSGFTPVSVLKWNGTARQTSVLSSALLQATIKASDVARVGTASVTVVNVDTRNETSNVAYFTVRKATPSVALIASPTFSATGFIADGDFNNDGKLDVVVCNSAGGGAPLVIDAYLGEGKLKFQSPIRTVIKGQFNSFGPVFAGDFNGDHILDLAVRFKGHGIWQFAILFGDGKGKFSLGPSTPTAPNGSIFPAGDVNGDGNLDLIATYIAKYNGPGLTVFFGRGDGTFAGGTNFGTGSDVSFGTPVVGDFNEDGNLDLAVPIADSKGSIVVALNLGGGKFGNTVTYQTNSVTSSLTTADVNGDGNMDLISTNGTFLLGKGDGTFTNGQNVGSGAYQIVGDFNGDGKLDLVSLGSPVSVLLGNGDGTFQPPILTGYGFSPGLGVATGSFRPDGRLDLVGSGSLFWQVPAGLYPNRLDFGQQNVGTKSPPQTATLVNADALPLPVTGIKIVGTNANEFFSDQQLSCQRSRGWELSNPGHICAPKPR
jgi:hypothetical protein